MARISIDVVQQDFIQTFKVKSQEAFTLTTQDNQEVIFARRLLRKCAFFENLFNNEPRTTLYDTDTTLEVLSGFKAYLEGRMPIPSDAYPYVKFGVRIQFEEFTGTCAQNASGFSIPQQAATDEVIEVIKAYIGKLPIRNAIFYAPLYKEIQNWDGNESDTDRLQVMAAVLDAFDRKRNETFQLADVPLFEKKLTVALLQIIPAGAYEIAAYVNNGWERMNVFGSNFNPENVEIVKFHLVYGQHVIYCTAEGTVFFKDLSIDEEPQLLFENCKIFQSHFGNLVIVLTEDNVDTVHYWSTRAKKFKKMFSNPHFVVNKVSLHRDKDQKLGNLTILGGDSEIITLDIHRGGDFKQYRKNNDDYEDVVGEWTRRRGQSVYRHSTMGTELRINKVTHIGFACLDVRALNDRFGVYETVNSQGIISPPHGEVMAISDVFLGVE